MADQSVLEQIHRALAAKIKPALTRDTVCYPFPMGAPTRPCISVYPALDAYLDYFTSFGPNGAADMVVRLKIEVDGDPESIAIKLCDYLSIGTGNNSSIIDAVNKSPRTLGGLVDDCVARRSHWTDPDTSPGVAWIDVEIFLTKQNAEV